MTAPGDRKDFPRPGDAGEAEQLAAALAAAVEGVGGTSRAGQQAMAAAVAEALDGGDDVPHALLVQAGTGTGKSLAYLVPAILHSLRERSTVVVATATIALQRQLVERDLPRVAEALTPLLDRAPTYAIHKGRSHYLCLHRLHEGSPDDGTDQLFDPAPTTALGRDVRRIREWADTTETGDRDELVPSPAERAWRSLSVTAAECLGQRCPYVSECFVEAARDKARASDVVVTNHASLVLDMLMGYQLLPEHDVVVVDEAHELVDRTTGTATDELTGPMVERAARAVRRHVEPEVHDDLLTASGYLEDALAGAEPGRVDAIEGTLFDALVAVRDAGHRAISAFSKDSGDGDLEAADRLRAKAAVEDVHKIAGRVLAATEHDVVWTTKPERWAPTLWRAPLSVAGLLRERLFDEYRVVATSATLTLGGSFDPVAGSYGLRPSRDVPDDADADPEGGIPAWRGLDVGSPFDYPRQGILYVARHLPPPGRAGLSDELLEELHDLVLAAGGRTLGLFSSMRAADEATHALRPRLAGAQLELLCQGDDATHELVRRFAAEPTTSLFGTLSLWQGVDVPGESCSLVVVDRIPFPRPDDPLASARQRAVERAGGNGFMAIAASGAALLLAQGVGRLIRSHDDRGVVAVLDSRLATARYAPYLVASLPPFWRTTSGDTAREALRRLAEAAATP